MVRKSEISWADAVMFTCLVILICLMVFGMIGVILASNGWALIPIVAIIAVALAFKYTPIGDKMNSWL